MSDSNVTARIKDNEFQWNTENGLLTFDGSPALLFWDTAFELLMETIEEISGSDAADTLYEATGFRMGKLVSAYYQTKGPIEQTLDILPNIYLSAGWGIVEFDYDAELKRATIRMKNSWEHRIVKMLGREKTGLFLPGHWAGIFSGLLKENMWFKIVKSQFEGNEFDEVEIFPSTITPTENIHNLTRRKEQDYIQQLERQVEKRTEELTELVKDLSSPVIPVLPDILVIPLIGKFDELRFEELTFKALHELSHQQAKYLLFDLTGIKDIDDFTIQMLHRLVQAITLIGGNCILVGISADLSIQITKSSIDLGDIMFFSTLQHGVQYALAQTGLKIAEA